MNLRVIVFIKSAFLLFFCSLNIAESQISQTKIVASDGNASDGFGFSVSVHGNRALIGAYRDDDPGSVFGSAYVFQFNGSEWLEEAKLIASDGEGFDNFGHSVALHGDYAFIGASSNDLGSNSGSVYVFHFNGLNWVEQQELTASDGGINDYFGISIAHSGEYVLIGAHGDFGFAGSAYIFHYDGSNWVEQAKLTASDRASADGFGKSVSMSGNYALVGAWLDDHDAIRSGSAYVFYFDGSNWIEQAKITASDREGGDQFGNSVSISGDYALVGAPDDDDSGTNSGSAYVFHFDGSEWIEEEKLIAGDLPSHAQFGTSISLSGNYALIGASNDDSTGSGYIFHYDGADWLEQTRLVPRDGAAKDWFGFSVSLSGDHAMIGAYGVDADGSESVGAVYSHTATVNCSKVSQFQARCRPGGLIKARVTMADASHEGDILEISIDDVPYQVVIDATGRGQLSQGGFSPGPHTVELTNPGQCFDPIVVTCRTSLDEEANDDWDDELFSESPTETALLGNYPNPFNPSTTIRYTLSHDASVSIRVYNMLGQEVATLVDGFQKAGEQSVTWHGTNNFGQSVASGLYVYKLQAGNKTVSQKMMFAK